MELTQALCGKRLGGVARLKLYEAAKISAVTYNSTLRAYTSVEMVEGCEPLDVTFAEGSGSWSERGVADGGVEHSVEFSLGGVDAEALIMLVGLSEGGLVAEVECADGGCYLVGYSREAAAEYPLRLASAEIATGSGRGDKPTTHIRLTSTDGWYSRRVEQ